MCCSAVQFFISIMAFATFAVDFAKSENRLQLTFILLLTTITFKFAVNQSLPRISYLTYLVSSSQNADDGTDVLTNAPRSFPLLHSVSCAIPSPKIQLGVRECAVGLSPQWSEQFVSF